MIHIKSSQRASVAERDARGYVSYHLRKTRRRANRKIERRQLAVIKVEPRVIVLKSVDLRRFYFGDSNLKAARVNGDTIVLRQNK